MFEFLNVFTLELPKSAWVELSNTNNDENLVMQYRVEVSYSAFMVPDHDVFGSRQIRR